MSSLIVASGLASFALAQQPIGAPRQDSFPDGFLNLSLVLRQATGWASDGLIGIARTPDGHYFVSSRRRFASGDHEIIEFGPEGALIATYQQPSDLNGDGLGIRDLAWDGSVGDASRIWGGVTGGELIGFDWQAGVFRAEDRRVLGGYVGPTVDNVTIVELGGQPAFLTSSGQFSAPTQGSPGNQVNYHPLEGGQPVRPPSSEVGSGVGKFGAAFDPVRASVWWHVDDAAGNPNPNASRSLLKEMDLVTGGLTGLTFRGSVVDGGQANGCEFYEDDFGHPVLVYLVSGPGGHPERSDVAVECYARFAFGEACGGRLSYNTEPYAGNQGGDEGAPWGIRLTDIPENGLGLAWLWRSATSVPGFGVPGIIDCDFYLNTSALADQGSAAVSMGSSGGSALWLLPIPVSTALIGEAVSFQALVPSPTVFPFQMSEAGALVITSGL